MAATDPRVVRLPTSGLSPDQLIEVRALLERAFADDGEGFTDADWLHAQGGMHVLARADGRIVAHAAVVDRDIRIGGRPVRTAYVEAVGVEPARQRTGFGTAVMRAVGALIRDVYELGALDTGSPSFYERLGWRVWRGPSGVRGTDGRITLTPDEDGGILVLETPSTPALDASAAITCEWRPGDFW